MKNIKVGINGIDYSYGNLGCQALAFSIMNELEEISKKDGVKLFYTIFFYKISEEKSKELSKLLKIDEDRIHQVLMKTKSQKQNRIVKGEYKKCDFIIDMSGGDSFSDIYGIKRMVKESFYKNIAIKNKIPLVLGPQTYGPYNHKLSKIIAKKIFKKAKLIFSRDEESAEVVKNMSGRESLVTTDIAMRLPYKKEEKKKNSIGINISALMWYGGYSGKNQFSIKLDYKKLIKKIIEEYKEKYDIYLFSHVNATGIQAEDDYLICKEISKKYNVKLAPKFENAIQAKSFISSLELVIASRMHATIAAFSTGVPAISIAYSKKFERLYNNLNYKYFINAMKNDTDEAYGQINNYIFNYDKMMQDVKESNNIANEKLKVIDNELSSYIKEVAGE